MNQTMRANLVVSADASEVIGEMRESKEAVAAFRREATVLGTDLNRSGASAEKFVSIFARGHGSFRDFSTDTKSARDSARDLGAALDQEEQKFRELVHAIDPAARAQAEFKAGQEAVNRAVRLGITTNEEAARTLQLLATRQDVVMRSMARGGATMMNFGQGMQNFSYQATDALVQWQGGVAAGIIFAQQAPQLLAGFGALGAGLGLVAAIAPVAISALMGTTGAGRTLDTVLGDLDQSTTRVSDSLKLLRDPELSSTFGTMTGDIRQMADAMLALERASELKNLRESLDLLLGEKIDPGYWQRAALANSRGQLGPTATADTFRADNYAKLTGGRGLSYEDFSARRGEIDALAKAGEVERVTSEVARLIRDMSDGGPVTDMNTQLVEMLLSLGKIARQTAEVEAQFNGTAEGARAWNALVEAGLSTWERMRERGREVVADGVERIRVAENELSLAQTIAQFGEEGRQTDLERARIARENYELELERAGIFEGDRDRLLEIFDATVATQNATAIWADNMAAVGAEVSSILSMIASLGGGLIDRASKQAELAALQGGASVADAAKAGRKSKQDAEWNARAQGGLWDRAVVTTERWWSQGDDKIDAEIAAAREAARLRDRKTAAGGGGGGLGAAASITAEIAKLRPSYEADIAAAEAWRDKALATLDKAGAGYAEFAGDVETIFQEKVAQAYRADLERRDDWQAGAERAFLSLSDDMMSWADLSENIVTNFAQSGEEAFARFATSGKASMEGFVDFVAEQFARLAYQQMILPGLNALFQSVFPSLPGLTLPTNHTGSPGVMRSYGPGGDTMRSDERLTMMRKGEEIMTSRALENAGALISAMTALATRPAQGGGGGDMNVQIVNTAPGVKVEREESSTDSRGQRQAKFVVSEAVATGLSTPGGRGGQTMKQVYGMSRAGRVRT